MQPVPSSAIVKMSELEALRNYNVLMNQKLKERDDSADHIIPASVPQQVEGPPVENIYAL